jgi:hypothetical protein
MAPARRLSVALAIGAGVLIMSASPSGAVPEHLHCVTTPGGTHAIAGGVTNHAPHDTAFHNLHGNVHLGAFATNPIDIAVDSTQPYTCPPSP